MLDLVSIILFTGVSVVMHRCGPVHSAGDSSSQLSVSGRLLSSSARQHGDGLELPLLTSPGQKPWEKHKEKIHSLW